MSALRPILEDFDIGADSAAAGVDVHTQKIKAAAYEEGFAAGKAMEAAQIEDDNAFFAQAASQLQVALSDLPTKLNMQLGEALVSVLQKVLPALSSKGFAQETATAILTHADVSNPGAVIVKVSEARVEQLTAALAEQGADKTVTIEIDPTLVGSTVSVFWKNAGLEMDIDQAVNASLASLENYLSQFKEEKTNDE